ncbi:MAG: DUF5667 domain-containing protein [Anaerolineaceae bacterium]|nr:DUF5667 domain-containing protein [Anaerolineaceae bacterium]
MNTKKDQPALDAELRKSLDVLQEIPARDANAALRGRNLFLAEARNLKHSVTPAAKRRHSKWMEKIQSTLPFRKEGVPVLTQVISALLILTTLFGGAGAGTVYAAQSSMPDDLLYPIKTWSENARLELAASPDKDVDLLLEFADRRIEEMLALTEEGTDIPEPLMTQLQTHLELATQLCDQVDDPLQTREQIRQALMAQQMLLTNAPEDAQMLRTHDMLEQKIHQIDQTPLEDGTLPEDALQPQDRDRLRTDQPEGSGNLDANGYQEEQIPGGPNPNPDASGQQSGGQNPVRTKTPMPGQSGQQQGPGGQGTKANSNR